MPERRLLLIDDDKTIHAVVRAALTAHGFQVHSAFDSVQATAAARQVKPDVIMLDLTMPGGGGFETFRRLQMLTTTAQIPILIYSSLPPEQVLASIPESSTVAHLPKPSSPSRFSPPSGSSSARDRSPGDLARGLRSIPGVCRLRMADTTPQPQ